MKQKNAQPRALAAKSEQSTVTNTADSSINFDFETLRNIGTKLDEKLGRKVISGQASVASILKFSIEKNVRESLFDHESKKRKKMSGVHRAILNTLQI